MESATTPHRKPSPQPIINDQNISHSPIAAVNPSSATSNNPPQATQAPTSAQTPIQKPIFDSNARAAQAFLTSKRKDTAGGGGGGTVGVGGVTQGGGQSSKGQRQSLVGFSPAHNNMSSFYHQATVIPENQHQHLDHYLSRSLTNMNEIRNSLTSANASAAHQNTHSQQQHSQRSPDRPSLSSPELNYASSYATDGQGQPLHGAEELANMASASPGRGLLSSGVLTTEPLMEFDQQTFNEHQKYQNQHPDQEESITQGGLDLESVIAHFEAVHLHNNSLPLLAKHGYSTRHTMTPTIYPRFTFYSEKTGVVRSNSWDTFDISFEDHEQESGDGGEGSVRDTLTTCPFWIDIASPTHQEMGQIAKVFNLHPLTTEDIQTPDTREKCEVFQRYYFVVIRSFEQDQFKPNFLQPITVYIVIFDECILSFQSMANPHSRNVRSRIDQLSSYGDVSITTEFINYALIDDIVDSFIPLLKVVELEVDSIEELVLIPVMKNDYVDMDMLRRIGMVRKRVMQLLRLISTKADVVKTIINRYMNQIEPSGPISGVYVETKFYLEDIHDHVLTMMQNLNHYEKSLARSHSNYLAQISIDITQASNRTSDTVMRMTLLASILVPLNVITGLFGMNVRVPGEEGDDLSWFFGIIAFMVVLTSSTYYLARRYKLI